jgi:hypothetical protein
MAAQACAFLMAAPAAAGAAPSARTFYHGRGCFYAALSSPSMNVSSPSSTYLFAFMQTPARRLDQSPGGGA